MTNHACTCFHGVPLAAFQAWGRALPGGRYVADFMGQSWYEYPADARAVVVAFVAEADRAEAAEWIRKQKVKA